jgi:multiple sugar transport system ATP-binding protein
MSADGTADDTAPALTLSGIRKRYDSHVVLDDVSLSLRSGEFVALVGPSGCGKSTLLRIAAGLEDHESGSVTINGKDVSGVRAADRDVAMVFQSYALYPHLTAAQNIALPLIMRRLTSHERWPVIGPLLSRGKRAAIRNEVADVAESLQIARLMERKPSQLSGGQRQRVALGRAIVRRPQAFLMDEPLSNLDAALRVALRSEIVALHRKTRGVTLYVTHDQEEALSMADRVAVMMGGRILQVGTPAEIYGEPAHIEVAKFIGVPLINLVDAAVGEGGTAVGLGAEVAHGLSAARGQVTVGFRPEAVTLAAEAAATAIPVSPDRVEFLGAEALVHVRVAATGQPLIARMSPKAAAAVPLAAPLHAKIDPLTTLVFDAAGRRIARTVDRTRGISHAA